ncbi:MAG: PBSX family phage terminase large subunit [Cetobacterium sp.]
MESNIESLKRYYNPKQILALQNDAKILVLYGAKRAGKTYILIIKFLLHVMKYRNQNVKFIIGGATMAAIRANILDDLEKATGIFVNLNKYNNFRMFGCNFLVRPGSNSDSWKGVRGFEAAGVLLNEGTALHDRYIKECISRCSGEGSKIYIDTNPENPAHPIKVDYIDKSGQILSSGRKNIDSIHFRLDDNTFLDPEYVESIKLSTPSGMFYDRDIEGIFVNAEGIIYKDFDARINIVDSIPADEYIIEYVGGVDWGFEHCGTIVVGAYTNKGNYYIVEEHTKQHMYVEEYWIPLAKRLTEKYKGIIFFADSARAEYINMFLDNNIETFLANKSVVPGIETVASFFKSKKLFILRDCSERAIYEISNYVWANKTGKEEPVKKDDDFLDGLRYLLFTHQQKFI